MVYHETNLTRDCIPLSGAEGPCHSSQTHSTKKRHEGSRSPRMKRTTAQMVRFNSWESQTLLLNPFFKALTFFLFLSFFLPLSLSLLLFKQVMRGDNVVSVLISVESFVCLTTKYVISCTFREIFFIKLRKFPSIMAFSFMSLFSFF